MKKLVKIKGIGRASKSERAGNKICAADVKKD